MNDLIEIKQNIDKKQHRHNTRYKQWRQIRINSALSSASVLAMGDADFVRTPPLLIPQTVTAKCKRTATTDIN